MNKGLTYQAACMVNAKDQILHPDEDLINHDALKSRQFQGRTCNLVQSVRNGVLLRRSGRAVECGGLENR